ncbi:MAG: hypothetical protein K0R54_36 [Clostridiaceae bacterium]|jgi:hypothetical protein|nr:hypothetical protein [Clostridiaceae bacterium]
MSKIKNLLFKVNTLKLHKLIFTNLGSDILMITLGLLFGYFVKCNNLGL